MDRFPDTGLSFSDTRHTAIMRLMVYCHRGIYVGTKTDHQSLCTFFYLFLFREGQSEAIHRQRGRLI